MDRQKAAKAASQTASHVTVGFWQGLAGALAGIMAAIVTAFLAATFDQLIIVGAVFGAGAVLYRCRKLRRRSQLIAMLGPAGRV